MDRMGRIENPISPAICYYLATETGFQDETMTTTKLLQQAFDKAAELPEDRQEAIARILLAELESEQKWGELFSRPESEDLLERMAAEALEAHRAGRTTPLNPENL